MKQSEFMDGIYTISEWIRKLAAINLLWIFFNIPVVFILINLLLIERNESMFVLLPILFLLLPFIFFPATQAMFASVREWVLKKEDNGLMKTYWFFYKDNYKNSLKGGSVLSIIWFIWYVDSYYFSQQNFIWLMIYIIIGVLLYVYSINFFSVSAHYNMKWGSLIKNTFLTTFASPALFITVLLSSIFILIISVNWLTFLLPFFSGSVIAFLSFLFFYKTYQKVIIKAGENSPEKNSK